MYSTIKNGKTGSFLLVEYSLWPQSHKCVLFQKWIMVISLIKTWKNCENFGADTYYIHVNLVIGTKDRLYSWFWVWISPWRSSEFCRNSLILKIAVAGQLVVTLDETNDQQWYHLSSSWGAHATVLAQHNLVLLLDIPNIQYCAFVWPVREVMRALP